MANLNGEKSFNKIIRMIVSACNDVFYNGAKDIHEKVVECATQIYIAQMKEGANND